MINAEILDIDVKDIRFPTSVKWKFGGHIMHTKLDHSCAYVTIETDTQYKGYSILCTSGIENEYVVQECKRLFEFIKNRTTTEIFSNFLSFWRVLTNNVEMRCVGVENSMTDLATPAIVNALWDLWARIEGKPVWKLLTDMTPEQLVSTVDFTCMAGSITEEDVIKELKKNQSHRQERQKELQEKGYPAYAADIGCWDRSGAKIRDHCKKYVKLQFDTFQVSITPSLEDNNKICSNVRKEISWKKKLLLGVNQIKRFESINDQEVMLQTIKPFSIEVPLSVNDPMILAQLRGNFLTHSMDSKGKPIKPQNIKLSYGETCANCDMFKQFKDWGADFWHVNVAKLGGINEILAIYFLTLDKARTDVSIWACAAGIGLGEMAQHLQIWDYICFSQTTKNRWIGFANYQHGYFENPVFIKNAHYMPPTLPGFSTKLKDKCIARWSYPEGTRWKHLLQIKHFKKDECEESVNA